jgi:hypothetical protein
MTTRWLAPVLVTGALLLGCKSGEGGGARAPLAPSDPTPVARCKVGVSQESPLVTEWPASEKANLESRLSQGGVVVAYSGCTLRILNQCHVKGAYRWQRTTPSSDQLEITNADELYAKLPIGAVGLEGELQQSGRLAVQTMVSGSLRLEGLGTTDVPRDGDCAGATHVLGGLTLGAFALKSGGARSIKGGIGISGGPSVGGGDARSEATLKTAGDAQKCGDASADAPSPFCASPLQMFLWKLPSSPTGSPGMPAAAADSVEVEFVPYEGSQKWNVISGGQLLCTAPCTRWVKRTDAITMAEVNASNVTVSSHEVQGLADVPVGGHAVARKRAWNTTAIVGVSAAVGGGFLSIAPFGVFSLLACVTNPNRDLSCQTWATAWAISSGVSVAGFVTMLFGDYGGVKLKEATPTSARSLELSPFGLSGTF